MKKAILLLTVVVLCAVFISCGRNSDDTPIPDTAPLPYSAGRLFAEPIEMSILAPLFESWPIRDDWPVLDFIRDATNVNLTVVPQVGDTLSLMVVAGTQPDILQVPIPAALPIIAEGIATNFFDYYYQMPDFFRWLNSNMELAAPFFSPGGELFMIPQTDIGEANRQGWMFRQDVFDRHGLQLPQNEEEFYQVLTQLQILYPGTNPLQLRNGLGTGTKICIMASQWNASFTYYIDRSTNTWRHGAVEDNFRDYVFFMNRLFNSGLIPADFLSVDTRSWQERMSAGQGFVTLDFLTRIDGFNIPMREQQPEFTLAFMPPFRSGPDGDATMQFTALNTSSFVVTNNVPNVIKYINWLFTDEAEELLSWGRYGETYAIVNGQRQFIDFTDTTDLRARTGLSTLGMYARFDYQSHVSLFSAELANAYALSRLKDQPPPGAVSFTEVEIAVLSTVGAQVQSHKEEMIARFIVGERPLSEWGEFVAEMYRVGLDRVLEVYNAAQARQ